MTDLGFVHRFVPGDASGAPVLLLLHGTGGNEDDLLPLGRELLPGVALLSPRGRVLENGMPRFFRRFREGVFDIDDLKFQTHALNDFIQAARHEYGLKDSKVVAVGYSNGANIAASVLLLHPHTLAGAALFRPTVPFTPDLEPNLARMPVFLSGGMRDPIVPRDSTEALAAMLASLGADTEVHWHRGGHEMGQDDVAAAQDWLRRKIPG
jgi:phospholipase/carboxylesterase/glyoxalase family protein